MELTYPAGPAAVPANLIESARGLRRLARIATLALAAFFLVYFALAAWLATSAARLLGAASTLGDNWGWMLAAGLAGSWLAAIMIKPLFATTRGDAEGIEVSSEEQPRLFRFLHRLADEGRAPRPSRVLLSGRMAATCAS